MPGRQDVCTLVRVWPLGIFKWKQETINGERISRSIWTQDTVEKGLKESYAVCGPRRIWLLTPLSPPSASRTRKRYTFLNSLLLFHLTVIMIAYSGWRGRELELINMSEKNHCLFLYIPSHHQRQSRLFWSYFRPVPLSKLKLTDKRPYLKAGVSL